MGKYKDTHGYSRFNHWLGLNKSVSDIFSDSKDAVSGFFDQMGFNPMEAVRSWLSAQTGESLTGAQREQNAFEQQMSDTAYQRQVADMTQAGVNPALALGSASGGASTPSGASSQPVASMSDIMQVAMLPRQMKMMDQQIKAEELENEKREVDLKFLSQEKTTALAFTSQQIENLKDALRNNEVERALKRSGISLNEANEALTIQNAIASAIDNETRDALNNAMLSYRAAETAYTEQKTEESKKQMDLMEAQVNELYQRAILEGAQAGVYDQQTLNMLQEYDILQYDKERKAFEVSKQNADRNWRIFNNVVGAITGVAGAAGSLMIGGSMLGNTLSRTRVLRGTLPADFYHSTGYGSGLDNFMVGYNMR